jgi:tight adherence protein C
MNRETKIVLAVVCGGAVAVTALVALAGFDPLQVILSGAMFLATSLLVIAVFSQPGQIEVSAQRAAALATGHTDRRTVFEMTGLGPPMWLLLLLAHRLSWPSAKNWLRRTLVAAGSPNYYTAEEYLAVSMGTGMVLGMALLAANFLVYQEVSLVALFGGAFLGTLLMIFQLYSKAMQRTSLISKRVPYALDLIALAMGAGATFTEAVKTVVREQGEDPFNVELAAMLAEIELGATRRKALVNLSDRVPLDSLRTIVASVVQAEELGTPLGNVLHDQATLLRQQRWAKAENAAAVAGVRILVPCLLLVLAVVLTVFGPAIIRGFRGGLF